MWIGQGLPSKRVLLFAWLQSGVTIVPEPFNRK